MSDSIFGVDVNFEKASDLIAAFFGENVFQPKHIFDVSELCMSDYVFRGQADKAWRLQPSAFRLNSKFENFTPQPAPQFDANMDVEAFLRLHMHAELRSVQLFMEAADSHGIYSALAYDALHEHDVHFKEGNVLGDMGFPHKRFYQSMAMAQHHGVPTRLLDWSYSPLVAAYFAAQPVSRLADKKINSEYITVVAINKFYLDQEKALRYIPVSTLGNPNIQAQKGAFILIDGANEFFIKNKRWPNIEDVVDVVEINKVGYVRPPFIRLSLPATEADELLRLLYRYGISEMSLNPSLANAANNFLYKRKLFVDG